MSPLAQSLGIASLSLMVGLQHSSMNGVYAWGFSTLHSFYGVFTFASDGGLMSMLRCSGAGGGSAGLSGWGGSELHKCSQTIYQPIHVRL